MIEKVFSTITVNGSKPMLKVEFKDKKYELLSTLLFADGSALCPFILDKYEEIRNNKISIWNATGNVCSIEMSLENTSVYDIFDDNNSCTLPTSDLIELIYDWNKEVGKLGDRI